MPRIKYIEEVDREPAVALMIHYLLEDHPTRLSTLTQDLPEDITIQQFLQLIVDCYIQVKGIRDGS